VDEGVGGVFFVAKDVGVAGADELGFAALFDKVGGDGDAAAGGVGFYVYFAAVPIGS